MKNIFYLVMALFLCGCGRPTPEFHAKKPVIFVSILPQAGLAKAIAGDLVDVHTLVGEGQSPHSFEPTPLQLTRLADSGAWFTVGIPFETHLRKKITPLYPNLRLAESQAGIALRTLSPGHECAHCSHDPSEIDQHVWLSPLNAARIAENICRVLQELEPDHAADFHENLQKLTTELERVDQVIRRRLAPYKGSRFYVFHPSYGYFAAAYGLEQVPVEIDGKTPSSRQLATLIEQAKADGIKMIFVQKQFPINSAKAVAEAIGGEVVPLDPLAEDSVANFQAMAESMVRAFKK